MNELTKQIAGWLKIDNATALLVQNEMAASGVLFGNSTLAKLKSEAKIALEVIGYF